ncbi:formylglycine-generating enzyme family protein [Phormidesmis sp. 146-12]
MTLSIRREIRKAQHYLESLGDTLDLDMVLVPEGSFLMGSPENEPERDGDESPQHSVTVAEFCMGKYPITQAQWRFVANLPQASRELDSDPSDYKGDDRPAENVSWHDATEFCCRLAHYTGRSYRLPSEAEWEYACRAETTTPFYFGNTITPDLANYDWNTSYGKIKITVKKKDFEGTTSVGQFGFANGFGLCDMHGNVWEWCEDHRHSDYEGAPVDGSAWIDPEAGEDASRVLRGGSWLFDPGNCRSATRYDDAAGGRSYLVGFRVVCSAPRTL